MAAIGRLDLARSLKRLLELTGTYEPAVGEGIVPTIQLFDIEETPFSPTITWCVSNEQPAVALQHSYIAIVPGESLGENGWISIDEIWIHNTTLAPQFINITPTIDAAVPFLATMVSNVAVRSRRQPGFLQGTVWFVPEVEVRRLSSATVIAVAGERWFTNALESTIVPVKLALRRGAVLIVGHNTVNADLIVTFVGRVHMTTAK